MFNRLRHALGWKLVAPLDIIPPSGVFEVAGKRCSGVVNDRYQPDWLPLTIDVEANTGKTLRVVESVAQSRGRYEFTFDINDGITAKDLLCVKTKIFAQNAYGLRALLKLDGATELNLIRQHFGVPQEVLFDLDFTTSGTATPYMEGGWSKPEVRFCWTDGKVAKLRIPTIVCSEQAHELTLTCLPMLAPPGLTSQGVTVTLNGYSQQAVFDAKTLGFTSFFYPAQSLVPSTAAEITLDLPDAEQPSRLLSGNHDNRLLGLAFKRLTFARLLQSPPRTE